MLFFLSSRSTSFATAISQVDLEAETVDRFDVQYDKEEQEAESTQEKGVKQTRIRMIPAAKHVVALELSMLHYFRNELGLSLVVAGVGLTIPSVPCRHTSQMFPHHAVYACVC